MNVKSPFVYLPHVMDPDVCDELALALNMTIPNLDEHDKPTVTYLYDEEIHERVAFALEGILAQSCAHYDAEFKGIESIQIEWVPPGAIIPTHSENSELVNKVWLKTKNRDFTCVLFLSTSCVDLELAQGDCVGGKMQFVNYGFGFIPQIGDCVIYPSDARFSNSTTKVHDGDLIQIRIHFTSKVVYIHDISKFPGHYTDWF